MKTQVFWLGLSSGCPVVISGLRLAEAGRPIEDGVWCLCSILFLPHRASVLHRCPPPMKQGRSQTLAAGLGLFGLHPLLEIDSVLAMWSDSVQWKEKMCLRGGPLVESCIFPWSQGNWLSFYLLWVLSVWDTLSFAASLRIKSDLRISGLERKGRIWIPVDILVPLNQPALKPALLLDVLLCEMMINSLLVKTSKSRHKKQTRGETPVQF